jgi:hypothetical protein
MNPLNSETAQTTPRKPYFLVCLEKPNEEPSQRPSPNKIEWSRWFGFSEDSKKIEWRNLGVERPNENTFLIPADRAPSSLLELLNLAKHNSVDYQVFLLGSAPQLCP